jgi:hypothetical protein
MPHPRADQVGNRRSLMDDGGGWKETQPWHDQRALGGHGHKINM